MSAKVLEAVKPGMVLGDDVQKVFAIAREAISWQHDRYAGLPGPHKAQPGDVHARLPSPPRQ